MKEAADLLEMDKEKGVAFNPVENGFVFSTAEIETYILRSAHPDEDDEE